MTWRLSEAIIAGTMLGPQAFGAYYVPATGATCAWGAAGIALGKKVDNTACFVADLVKEQGWRPLVETKVECPVCGLRLMLGAAIAHLNSRHARSREEIAAFVARFEETAPTETVEVEEAVAV